MAYTKDEIKRKLESGDRQWLTRGLMAIYEGQTSREKLDQATSEDNGVGFTGFDAQILSSFAEQWRSKQWLSEKQFAILQKRMVKYAGQLAKIAAEKATAVQVIDLSDTRDQGVIDNNPLNVRFPDGTVISLDEMQAEGVNGEECQAWSARVNNIDYIVMND